MFEKKYYVLLKIKFRGAPPPPPPKTTSKSATLSLINRRVQTLLKTYISIYPIKSEKVLFICTRVSKKKGKIVYHEIVEMV